MYYLAYLQSVFVVSCRLVVRSSAFGCRRCRFDSGRHPPYRGTYICISDLRSSLRLSLVLRASVVPSRVSVSSDSIPQRLQPNARTQTWSFSALTMFASSLPVSGSTPSTRIELDYKSWPVCTLAQQTMVASSLIDSNSEYYVFFVSISSFLASWFDALSGLHPSIALRYIISL